MYNKCFNLFVSVSITILCHGVQSQSSSACRTPSGDAGDCISIYNCDPLLLLLTTFSDSPKIAQLVKDSQCGFQDQTPKVCCPRECFTPDEQLGKCVSINSCPTIINMLKQDRSQSNIDYVWNSKCEIKDELAVCCGPPPKPPPSPRARCVLSSAMPDPRGRCCGRESEAGDRIVGGNETTVDQYPWMAVIEYRKSTSLKNLCGGALISGKYVLTAAHCVLGPTWQPVYPVNVRLGEYDIANEGKDCTKAAGGGQDCNDGAIVIPIQRTIPHPEFTPGTRLPKNDIALIKLKETVNYTEFIRPICLPTSDVFENLPQELTLVAAGWGINDTEAKTSSNVKLHVKLPYKTLEHCQPFYKLSSTKLPLWQKQICAGGEKGKDSCPGDSGGPLMYKANSSEDPVFEVVGIISFGLGCGNENIPGVYTKVYEYVAWIRSQITP